MFKKIVLAVTLLCSSAFATQITAQSWIQTDGNGNLIDAYNATEVRSIASITKLMTVMVVLDAKQDLNEKLGNFTRLQHIQLALIKSDNNSAKVLCDSFPGGKYSCVQHMNEKAAYLNMFRTKFVEPTGLSPMNISTALDLVSLVFESSRYPEITEASHTAVMTLTSKKKSYTIRNTNPAVKDYNFIVSKTGTTNAAGGCIAMMVDMPEGRRVVVVLGSKNGRTRIPEAVRIAST